MFFLDNERCIPIVKISPSTSRITLGPPVLTWDQYHLNNNESFSIPKIKCFPNQYDNILAKHFIHHKYVTKFQSYMHIKKVSK